MKEEDEEEEADIWSLLVRLTPDRCSAANQSRDHKLSAETQNYFYCSVFKLQLHQNMETVETAVATNTKPDNLKTVNHDAAAD